MRIGLLKIDGKEYEFKIMGAHFRGDEVEFEFITYGSDKKPVTVGSYIVPKAMALGGAKGVIEKLSKIDI